MSGWGRKDDKTSTGTVAISAAGAVTGTSTAFTTEAAVGDILTANSIDFRITAIASNTAATVVDADTPGATITAISAGENYTLSEKPSGMIKANSGSRLTSEKVFGVDQTEMGVTNGPAHAGWVAVHTIGSGGSQRKQYETLVALSSAAAADMGDAEDTEFADS
tara:strand:- start:2034 stop:2525 length:492 start_codon:yes stop_codon:yes gene_type:complete